jgi:hypothetical protein
MPGAMLWGGSRPIFPKFNFGEIPRGPLQDDATEGASRFPIDLTIVSAAPLNSFNSS